MSSGIMADDTMFYVGRDTPWHGMGKSVAEAPNAERAMFLSGNDWDVISQPMFIEANLNSFIEGDNTFFKVPNVFANVHGRTGQVLGTVTGKYKIVQNSEAFSFTDGLLGGDVRYETAGSLFNGKKVWILARMPDCEMVGDKYENYLFFINSHDGKGAIKVVPTQVRVVCQNTANMALKSAVRSWSTKHMGNMESKMAEAHRTLELAGDYIDSAKIQAEALAAEKMSNASFELFVKNLIPISTDAVPRAVANLTDMRDELMFRYMKAPDLANLRGTKWGAFQAVSDFATHRVPQRLTATYKENLLDKSMNGLPLIDLAYDLLTA